MTLIERIRRAKKAPDLDSLLELKAAALEESKVRVDYSTVLIDHGDSGFQYLNALEASARWVN